MSSAHSEEKAKAREPRNPTEGGALARLFRGGGYLGQGWSFVFGNPSLLKYCILPFVINLLVFTGVAFGLYHYYGDIVAWIWAKPDSFLMRMLWYVLYVFILALVLLLSYVAFFVVQAILSAPFNDLLSERTESMAFGREPPPFSFGFLMRGLGRTVLHELLKLGIYLSMMVPLFLLNLVIPVLGPALFLFVGFYISSLFFAYDFMDFSMARREWRFAQKRALLKQNRALVLGFGSAFAGALLIPVLGMFFVPMAAVGGTLLFCDLEASEGQANEASPKPTERSLEAAGEQKDAGDVL